MDGNEVKAALCDYLFFKQPAHPLYNNIPRAIKKNQLEKLVSENLLNFQLSKWY